MVSVNVGVIAFIIAVHAATAGATTGIMLAGATVNNAGGDVLALIMMRAAVLISLFFVQVGASLCL